MQDLATRFRNWWNLRNALILVFRVLLLIAGGSLAYLLFIFGHTDVTPMDTILEVAALAGTCALLAAILQWVGLPADPSAKGGKKPAKH